jgi:Cu+-exporting ATPase
MTVAVVFDSAGTLLSTYRVAKDVARQVLMPGVETTTLTFASPDRVLIVLPVHSKHLISTEKDELLSEYLTKNEIGFGISCTRKITTADEISRMLYSDRVTKVGDLQECIRDVWRICKDESTLTLNSGAILNMASRSIEFAITAGGWPFDGAKETITALHTMGVPTFIASGDRSTKLEIMADHLGIPRDRVYGVATPTVKAQIVTDLKDEYDHVVMVGDGINDICAFKAADTAILTVQQAGERPEKLFRAADFVVKEVGEVLPIVRDLVQRPATSRS